MKRIALALAVALTATAAHAQDPDDARQHFTTGVLLLRDPGGPRYEEAYRAFRASYHASHNPKVLGNLGLCAMKLERDGEAVAAFTTYLEEAPDLAPLEREQIERDLATLRAGLVTLSVETDPPGATLLDTRVPTFGERVKNAYGPIQRRTELSLRQGKHVIVAHLQGYLDETWEIEADAGSRAKRTIVFRKPPAPPIRTIVAQDEAPAQRPVPSSVLALGATTILLGAGAAVTGMLAVQNRDEYAAANGRVA
jgi:hypothetical protein